MLFAPADLTGEEIELQREVRAFLAQELPRGTFTPGLGMGARRDRAFSARLAQRGWLGINRGPLRSLRHRPIYHHSAGRSFK